MPLHHQNKNKKNIKLRKMDKKKEKS